MSFYDKFKAMTKNVTHMGKFLQNYLAFKRKPIVVVIAIVFYTILFNPIFVLTYYAVTEQKEKMTLLD